jgi:hypothetical protein
MEYLSLFFRVSLLLYSILAYFLESVYNLSLLYQAIIMSTFLSCPLSKSNRLTTVDCSYNFYFKPDE